MTSRPRLRIVAADRRYPAGYRGGMRIALCQIPVSSEPGVNLRRVRDALARGRRGRRRPRGVPRGDARPVRLRPAGGGGAARRAVLLGGRRGLRRDGRRRRGRRRSSRRRTGGSTTPRSRSPPTGERVASYRKLHLFDAFSQQESDLVAPGSDVVLTPLAGRRGRPADLLRHPVPRADPGPGGGRRLAGHGQRGLAGGAVQGGALGDAAARPGDREHRVDRRRRPGARPRREADPRADRGRAVACSSTRSAWSAADLGPSAGVTVAYADLSLVETGPGDAALARQPARGRVRGLPDLRAGRVRSVRRSAGDLERRRRTGRWPSARSCSR